jgi:hypothetical protein
MWPFYAAGMSSPHPVFAECASNCIPRTGALPMHLGRREGLEKRQQARGQASWKDFLCAEASEEEAVEYRAGGNGKQVRALADKRLQA